MCAAMLEDGMPCEMEMDELFERTDGEQQGMGFEEEDYLGQGFRDYGGGYRGGAAHTLDEDDDDESLMEELDEDAEYILPPSSLYATTPAARSVRSETFGEEDEARAVEKYAALHGTLARTPTGQSYLRPTTPPTVDALQDQVAANSDPATFAPPPMPPVAHHQHQHHQHQHQIRGPTTEDVAVTTVSPTVTDFKIIRVIGKGSFGKVFLVRQRSTQGIFAMKVLKKENIVKRNQVEHTKTERSVLGYVRHPFVVGLHAAFQTRDKLYFILDYCAGGELFCHLQKLGKFPENRARFYTAELALALEHVHGLGVVYRDLKPENVLLDARGHVRLTDFGLSKEGVTAHHKGAHSFCGTPEYLAPEILARRGHGRAVDWWSLGALLFEMLTGLPPFYSRDREQLFEGIKRGHLAYPRSLSLDAKSLLKALLHREPAQRLGSGPTDAAEVKKHAFFKSVDFDGLLDGTVPAPWQPDVYGSLDTSQFDREFTSLPIHSPPQHSNDLHHSNDFNHPAFAGHPQKVSPRADETFAGFTYVAPSALHQRLQRR